jgi:hypothetical protein
VSILSLVICVRRQFSWTSLALVLWCDSIRVRQIEILSMNRQGNCVVCVHFDRSVVSFDVLRLGQRGIWLFSGFPPFLVTILARLHNFYHHLNLIEHKIVFFLWLSFGKRKKRKHCRTLSFDGIWNKSILFFGKALIP